MCFASMDVNISLELPVVFVRSEFYERNKSRHLRHVLVSVFFDMISRIDDEIYILVMEKWDPVRLIRNKKILLT